MKMKFCFARKNVPLNDFILIFKFSIPSMRTKEQVVSNDQRVETNL